MITTILKSSALVATVFGLSTVGAHAQFDTTPAEANWYVSGYVGASFPSDLDTNIIGVGGDVGETPTEIGINFDTDVTFGGAIGRRFGFKFFNFIQPRAELEVSYFSTGISSIDGLNDDILDDLDDLGGFDDLTAEQLAEAAGDIDVLFVLASSYSDLIWQENQLVIPYIGGGLGIASIEAFDLGSDTNFAGTTALGVTVPLGTLEVYGEGRYFRVYASGPDFDGFQTNFGMRLKF